MLFLGNFILLKLYHLFYISNIKEIVFLYLLSKNTKFQIINTAISKNSFQFLVFII